jgi:hypothetical protein
MTDWSNVNKIRIANNNPSFRKHEVVKTLLVMELLWKYRKFHTMVRIYTEFRLSNNRKCDIYFENLRTKSVHAFEIQNELTNEYLEKLKEDYSKIELHNMTFDWSVIPLKDCPDNLKEIDKWIKGYVI